MNPTVDNDLQKAIDDITNNTNQDPVFADPVAAPSTIPEGDTGELASPVGPFPAPKPIARRPKPAMPAPIPEPASMKEPVPMPEMTPAPLEAPEPIAAPAPETMPAESTTIPADMQEVRAAVLRDLAPIVNKIDMDPSKKFDLYKNIREELHDDSVLAPAYEVVRNIPDDEKRADALLYILNATEGR